MSNDDDDLQIKCTRRGCGWSGLESELKLTTSTSDGASLEAQVCPKCGNNGFYIIQSAALSRWQEERKIAAAARAVPAGGMVPDDWTPTAENIAALPEPVRRYIRDLRTNCDPAGIIAQNILTRDALAGLQIMYRKAVDAGGAVPPELIEQLAPAIAFLRGCRENSLADAVEAVFNALLAAQAASAAAAMPMQTDPFDDLEHALMSAVENSPPKTLAVVTGAFVSLALGILKAEGHDPDREVKINGGENRDITIHAPKEPASHG